MRTKGKNRFKIKRVKSWKASPFPELPTSLKGFTHIPSKTIYLREDTPSTTKEHEKYHVLKRHPVKPKSPSKFVEQEIMATLYAYHKLGRPAHILGRLRGVFWELIGEMYKLTPSKAMAIIKSVLLHTSQVPQSWKDDYLKLVKEYKRAYSR